MCKIGDPQYWRHRAQEARTLADALTDPDAKRKMLKIAEDYEKLTYNGCAIIRQQSEVNWRSQPNSQAARDGSDRPSTKTSQGNMPSIKFMSDAIRKASLLN